MEAQLEGIEAKIIGDLKPVRPLPPARFFLFASAIIFLLAVAIGTSPFALTGWRVLSIGRRVAMFATLAASAASLAVSMVAQMVPASRYSLAPRAVPIAVLSGLLLVIGASFHRGSEPDFIASGLMCMRSGLTYALPAAFLFWLVVRQGAILNPRLIGVMAGGLAGLIGLSVLEMNCSNLNVLHIFLWHSGVLVISSIAGALLGAAVEFVERRRARNAL
jgi:hypothetical protein